MKQILLSFFLFFTISQMFGQSESSFAFNSVKPTTDGIELTIYPNPFSSYIKVNDREDVVKYVTIYNLLGKKMKQFVAVRDQSYYVSDLPRGMYFVQLIGQKEKVLKTQRIQKR